METRLQAGIILGFSFPGTDKLINKHYQRFNQDIPKLPD
jgi:hypothetical protein